MKPLHSIPAKSEIRVWTLLSLGHTTCAIAKQLNLSSKTIDNQRAALYRKLGVNNVADATRMAIGYGIITAPTMLQDSTPQTVTPQVIMAAPPPKSSPKPVVPIVTPVVKHAGIVTRKNRRTHTVSFKGRVYSKRWLALHAAPEFRKEVLEGVSTINPS